jgi:predicted TPR repeat methyltransferase
VQALQSFQALSSLSPEFAGGASATTRPADTLARWGLQLFNKQKFSDAIAAFRSATALQPENAEFWANYGTALDSAGRWSEATRCLERSLSLSRRQADVWTLLGLVRKKLKDFLGAETAFRVALHLEPKSAATWQCLAVLQTEQREYDDAIRCFEMAQASTEPNAVIEANLGKLYLMMGRVEEACPACDRAFSMDPANVAYRELRGKAHFLRDLIGGAPVDEAVERYRRCLVPVAGLSDKELLEFAFGHLSGFGHAEAAKRVGKKYVDLRPESKTVQYLMHAIDGDASLGRSPADYVVEYFDSFASGFDDKLVRVLGYAVPGKLVDAIRQVRAQVGAPAGTPVGVRVGVPVGVNDPQQEAFAKVLDAGCGTGLCGLLLRPMAKSLTGVDLSTKMLEQAAARGVYDELVCEELAGYLNRSEAQFDCIVAADVLIYIGDMRELFEAAKKAIKPGGLFAFSTELLSAELVGTESRAAEGYTILPSGRFAHSPSYVRESGATAGFDECFCSKTTIRLEAGKPATGNLFVFRLGF